MTISLTSTMAATKEAMVSRKGVTCSCGKFTAFSMWVYAHWNIEIAFTCECKKKFNLRGGVLLG